MKIVGSLGSLTPEFQGEEGLTLMLRKKNTPSIDPVLPDFQSLSTLLKVVGQDFRFHLQKFR